MSSTSIQEILQQHGKDLRDTLKLSASGARIEIHCLLQEVMQLNRARILSHPERLLSDAQYTAFMKLFQRRLGGEPIAYLLGYREFYGLKFDVTPATLIPRPETELLVDSALLHIPLASTCRILDMGTGCGAIALSIAHLRPRAKIVAVDCSEAALEVARANMTRLELANATVLLSDWFQHLQGEQFDIIVSNPPYVAENDIHLEHGDLRYEPRSALVSGIDGLRDISTIIATAKDHLRGDGWLLVEHGYNQAEHVRGLLSRAGFHNVFSSRDLAGIERVSGGSCLA
ncbi:MAG: peptide chain release factor N(5)-glutamine methyltransferase [Gallionella sp.]